MSGPDIGCPCGDGVGTACLGWTSGGPSVDGVITVCFGRIWGGPSGDGEGTACLGLTSGGHLLLAYVQRVWAGHQWAHVVMGQVQHVWATHQEARLVMGRYSVSGPDLGVPCGDGVGAACLGRTSGAHVLMG